ncbi:uncharacterized protein LOC142550065 [Primulina tabacum]|uniref:uncharacterized protein LOC142550065 n=1 Tax=Primulina tabacum TaxID=48773 RepID=UPI003F592DED
MDDFFNDRFNGKYKVGVEEFLNYAFKKTSGENSIRCPCVKCNNTGYGYREVVEMHLNVNGIMLNYTTWYHHGERLGESSSDDEESEGSDYDEILRDLYPNMNGFHRSGSEIGSSSENKHGEEPNDEAKKFYRLLKDSEQPTYPGCDTSKLSVLVKLLHIKSIGRWSNESFDMLLQLLKQILPEEDKSNMCKICGASRWKENSHNEETKVRNIGKKLAVKTLHYFPLKPSLKPRLQRLFMSKKTASFMRWHHEKRVYDGLMRHPVDSMAWKSFDDLHKDFSIEP